MKTKQTTKKVTSKTKKAFVPFYSTPKGVKRLETIKKALAKGSSASAIALKLKMSKSAVHYAIANHLNK